MTQVKVTISYIVDLDPANAEHYDYPDSRVRPNQNDHDKVLNMAEEDVDAVNQGQMLFNEQALGSELKVVALEVVEEDLEAINRSLSIHSFGIAIDLPDGYAPMMED